MIVQTESVFAVFIISSLITFLHSCQSLCSVFQFFIFRGMDYIIQISHLWIYIYIYIHKFIFAVFGQEH